MATTREEYSFADILANPHIRERWQKVRRYFFLRESTYDMSNRCNIRCQGCYYYVGDKQFARENRDEQAWRNLLLKEKERGITFVVLAGAEPSLVADLCRACYE
ncbi:MAG TPA: radical SAM protein, partial [Desulfopila sp.]|nr:radical SAM protein [Desulfopila sp.]